LRESAFKPPSVLYRRRRTRLLVLIAALLASLVLVLGFWLGQQAAYSGMGVDSELYREMQRELPAARERVQDLAHELEVQRTRNEVDRQALEMVRSDIARQKEQIAGLEEGLRFYRSLMAPGEIAQGLSLRDIELIARTDPGRYAFRIVAQQEALKHQMLKGELYVEVFGIQGGERKVYPLVELSDDLDEGAVPLRFRYFQAIEGELVIPDGFQPEGFNVFASATTPRKAEVREQYSWRVQERFTHVGK
jgi:predicted transcriptional regulator